MDDLKVIRPKRPKKHKPKRKEGVLAEDMYEFLTLLDGYQDERRRGQNSKPYRMDSVYACKMLALTGVRVGEAVQMTWKEVHSDVRRYLASGGDLPPMENMTWNVHLDSMKVQGDDDPRPIPITSSVMEILREMWDRNPHGDNDPVFRGQKKERGFFYTHNAINDVFKRIGWIEEGRTVSVHGFRGTLTSFGGANIEQCPHYKDLIEIQLHHKTPGTKWHYSKEMDRTTWVLRFKMMQHYDDDVHQPNKVKAEPVWDEPVI